MSGSVITQQPDYDDLLRKGEKEKSTLSPELDMFLRRFNYIKDQKTKKGELVKLEDFPDLFIQEKNASVLSPDDRKKLMETHVKHRSTVSKEYTDDIEEAFEGFLHRDDSFHILRLTEEGEILAFLRSHKDQREGHRTIGSLNTVEGLENTGIGRIFYEELLSNEFKDDVLHANTNPLYRFFKHHIEDYGFNAEEVVPYGKGGEIHVNVRRDLEENEKLFSRQKTRNEIVQDYQNGVDLNNYETHFFDLETEKPGLTALFKQKINNDGMLLTRYIVSKEDPDKVCVVFEDKK